MNPSFTFVRSSLKRTARKKYTLMIRLSMSITSYYQCTVCLEETERERKNIDYCENVSVVIVSDSNSQSVQCKLKYITKLLYNVIEFKILVFVFFTH